LATGEARSIREFCELAFARVDLDWEKFVRIDERYARPSEVDALVGDAGKAKSSLGWEAKVRIGELVHIMVDADVKLLDDELAGRLVRTDR
ncbi:MAG: GDP-mannose 4,6-dehydratase, partial [Vicinamibacterales bacterium]